MANGTSTGNWYCLVDGTAWKYCWGYDWEPRGPQAVTFGDINADGKLEVVFGTTSGHIYALDAATGLDIRNFPFETRGRILAPVLLDRVVRGRASMQAVVLSFDGHLYIVDGMSGERKMLHVRAAQLG